MCFWKRRKFAIGSAVLPDLDITFISVVSGSRRSKSPFISSGSIFSAKKIRGAFLVSRGSRL